MLKLINRINELRKKSHSFIITDGIEALIEKIIEKVQEKVSEYKYNKIINKEINRKFITKFSYNPLISIIVPTYNTPDIFLHDMVKSVKEQLYTNWELCIADASTNLKTKKKLKELSKEDKRIKIIFLENNEGISNNTNVALSLATGDYIGLLDHDDILAPNTLYEIVKVINENPLIDFIYTDEDKVNTKGNRYFSPHFKPDFSPYLLTSCNYITHFIVFKRNLLNKCGMLNSNYDGSQDHEFILRVTDQANAIKHIPKILYHWRCHEHSVASNPTSKNYAYIAGKKAIKFFYNNKDYKCKVKDLDVLGYYKVDFRLLDKPRVHCIIRNIQSISILNSSLNDIIKKSNYKNKYITVLISDTLKKNFVKEISEIKNNINILFVNNKTETKIINELIKHDNQSQYFILLDGNLKVQNKDWIEQMLMYCSNSKVQVVGSKTYYHNKKIKQAGLILDSKKIIKWLYRNKSFNYRGYFFRSKLVQNLSAVSWECIMLKATKKRYLNENYSLPLAIIDYCLTVNSEKQNVVFNPFIIGIYRNTLKKNSEEFTDSIVTIKEFKKKWYKQLKNDPYFNPNLKLKKGRIKINLNRLERNIK